MKSAPDAASTMESYYRFHSRIYDATRWCFLFGRAEIIDRVRSRPARRILEVGCGTGKNLAALRRAFPRAEITGLDISKSMLEVAQKTIDDAGVCFLHQPYDKPAAEAQLFDLILFSYSLSMINPGWERAIECAHRDLAPGGRIAVVDFRDTPLWMFRRWMAANHVRMENHLLPRLKETYETEYASVHRAFGGMWSYFLFIGRNA
jgi:S-adenosylmethionine-diacylgycerolhomoserine-N-methlytransferase